MIRYSFVLTACLLACASTADARGAYRGTANAYRSKYQAPVDAQNTKQGIKNYTKTNAKNLTEMNRKERQFVHPPQ